ncbi:hypothetical protein MGMO_25c00620 [Methyloglobulus morosus KoM1]|uniref:Uncharacterized protein n=1 Tax=Methyloglobulus morosus KoM1 TaxID=1116472 RepID=V5BZX4_9GAMM|nr:hypothetical protein MGMO_25c00620 [Methyloglobulus morosus KoM1]
MALQQKSGLLSAMYWVLRWYSDSRNGCSSLKATNFYPCLNSALVFIPDGRNFHEILHQHHIIPMDQFCIVRIAQDFLKFCTTFARNKLGIRLAIIDEASGYF